MARPKKRSGPKRSKRLRSKAIKVKHVEQAKSSINAAEIGLMWEQMDGLSRRMRAVLGAMGFSRPTEIQQLAVPEILNGKNVVCAAPTGTGKTLAYMVPLVNLLKHEEDEVGVYRQEQRPRALVIVPTKELAEQVTRVAKMFSHQVKLSVRCVTAGAVGKTQKKQLFHSGPIDILVTTPGRLLSYIRRRDVHLSQVKHVVVDEADTMYEGRAEFGDAMAELFVPLIKRMERTGENVQFTLATATLRPHMKRLLRREYPNLEFVETSHVHTLSPKLKSTFIKLSGRDKMDVLREVMQVEAKQHMGTLPPRIRPMGVPEDLSTASVLQGSPAAVDVDDQLESTSKPPPLSIPRTLVFCNTVDCCRAVDYALEEMGISRAGYHSKIMAVVSGLTFSVGRACVLLPSCSGCLTVRRVFLCWIHRGARSTSARL